MYRTSKKYLYNKFFLECQLMNMLKYQHRDNIACGMHSRGMLKTTVNNGSFWFQQKVYVKA